MAACCDSPWSGRGKRACALLLWEDTTLLRRLLSGKARMTGLGRSKRRMHVWLGGKKPFDNSPRQRFARHFGRLHPRMRRETVPFRNTSLYDELFSGYARVRYSSLSDVCSGHATRNPPCVRCGVHTKSVAAQGREPCTCQQTAAGWQFCP